MNGTKFLLSNLALKILTFDYWVIKKVIKKYSDGLNFNSILDLGCGTGYLSNQFPSEKYLGVDIDQNAIKFAKKTHKNYRYQTGDATNLNLKKEFDLILIIGVLHHLDNKQSIDALKSLKKHFNKRSRAIILEAIPPISKWNFPGQILRALDRGHFVRNSLEYEKIITLNLKIYSKELRRGGFLDYAVFFVGH